MKNRRDRLTTVTPEELEILRAKADEMAELQDLLNKLPLKLQVESLSDQELQRLRQIAHSPATNLCGDSLLLWNNLCRRPAKLQPLT